MTPDPELPALEHTIYSPSWRNGRDSIRNRRKSPRSGPNSLRHGGNSVRSIADAIDALRNEAQLTPGSFLQVQTRPIRLPSGEEPSLIFLTCRNGNDQPLYGVALPTSLQFTGRSEDSGSVQTFPIARLNRARVHEDSLVVLEDGTRLQAVSVIPTPLPYTLTEIQKRIIYWTIALLGGEDCYRYGRANPDLDGLDYSALYGLSVPTLNVIERHIYKSDPTLRKISRQTIANALSACGMRLPRSGPRARKQ